MKNNTPTITFILKMDKPRKDNTYPIYVRIYKDRRTIRKKTEFYSTKEAWSVEKNNVKSSHPLYSIINKGLTQIRLELLKEIAESVSEKKLIKIEELINKKDRVKKEESYSKFLEELISEKQLINYGYSLKFKQLYHLLHNAFYKFKNKKPFNKKRELKVLKCYDFEIMFTDITEAFVNYVATYLDTKGSQSWNTHKFYFKTFKTSISEAKKKGICIKEFNPFENFKINKSKSRIVKKDFLKIDEISIIKNKDLSNCENLNRVRAFFLISYYLRGINVADLVTLKKSDVINDRIKYNRTKTHQAINSIKIDKAKPYIDAVIGKGEYLLDILDNKCKTKEKIYSKRRTFNKWLNDGLVELAKYCGIDKKITSYTARDSYAMNIYLQNKNINN
jgi:RNA-binding protein YhbY